MGARKFFKGKRLRRRIKWEMGSGIFPQTIRKSGERRKIPYRGVRDRALAENRFSAFLASQYTFGQVLVER